MKKLLFTISMVFISTVAYSACPSGVCYVRPDGGTNSECTGGVDAPYPGSGTAQACALKHPFYAIGWYKYADTNPPSGGQSGVMTGGDEVIISPATYVMGNDPSGQTFGCGSSAQGCTTRTIPSGTSGDHTKILGCTSSGCTGHCKIDGGCPELTATGRLKWVFNIRGREYIDFVSLNVTDSASCGKSNDIYDCGAASVGDGRGEDGVVVDTSTNITWTDSWIHGFWRYNIWGGKISNWTLTDTVIEMSGLNNWELDNQNGDSSNSGTIAFVGTDPVLANPALNKCTLNFSGCTEDGNNPGTIIENGCDTENADGIGTQNTSGDFSFTQCDISFNGHDGIDMLYLNKGSTTGGTLTVKRSRMEGNRGNAVKGPNNMILEDNHIVGNCGYHRENPATATPAMESSACRASGNPVVIAWRENSSVSPTIYNNTITSNGDTMIVLEGPDTETCTSGKEILLNGNLLMGGRSYNDDSTIGIGSGNKLTSFWFNSATEQGNDCHPTLIMNNNTCTGEFRDGRDCTDTVATNGNKQTNVSGNSYVTTPTDEFTGTILQGPTNYYTSTDYIDQLFIKVGATARNSADCGLSGTDIVDFNNWDRSADDSNCDSSGFEYGTVSQGGGAAQCTAQTINNCDLVLTNSGSSDGTCASGYSNTCSYSCTDGVWSETSNTCTIDTCGNGTIDAGEDCDTLGPELGGATCCSLGFSCNPASDNLACTAGTCQFDTSSCVAITCGDGYKEITEECDDGNTIEGDGCSSLCENENANYELFLTYTKVDVPGELEVTTHKSQMNGITHNADNNIYKDFGDGFFGDFTQRFKIVIDSCNDNGSGEDGGAGLWAMSEILRANMKAQEDAGDGLALSLSCLSSFEQHNWKFVADGVLLDSQIDAAPTLIRYLETSRSGTTGTIKFYSDPTFSTLLFTLSGTVPTTTYRYLYTTMSYNSGVSGTSFSGSVSEMDITADVAGPSNPIPATQSITITGSNLSVSFP